MGLHYDTPIYRETYALLDLATDLTRNIPRDFKRQLGGKVHDECVEALVLIFRANCAAYKAPHIEELLERIQVIELLFRLFQDKKFISKAQYAKAIKITDSIGRQANGWKKSSKASPAT